MSRLGVSYPTVLALALPCRAHHVCRAADIRVDICLGMAFSNVVAFFTILTAASPLHVHRITQISTSAQAAMALEPLARRSAFALFVCGIVGTGLLAVPVLAASAAYGIAEACR